MKFFNNKKYYFINLFIFYYFVYFNKSNDWNNIEKECSCDIINFNDNFKYCILKSSIL